MKEKLFLTSLPHLVGQDAALLLTTVSMKENIQLFYSCIKAKKKPLQNKKKSSYKTCMCTEIPSKYIFTQTMSTRFTHGAVFYLDSF